MILLVTLAFADLPDWCTDPSPLGARDEQWCDSVPAECTGLAKACADERAARLAAPQGGCSGSADEAAPKEKPKPAFHWSWPASSAGSALEVGGGWLILGLVLVGVLVALLRRYLDRDLDDTAASSEAVPLDPEGEPVQVGVTLGAGWWTAALRARDAGRIVEALLIARAAVVAHLEGEGRILPDPGRTDRELVRAIYDAPEAQTGLRVLVAAIERARYAGVPLGREAVDGALRAAARLTGLAVAFLLTVAPAWAGPGDHSLLRDVLEEQGITVDEATEVESGDVQLWIPSTGTTQEELDAVLQVVQEGTLVYVFGTDILDLVEPLGLHDRGPSRTGALYVDGVDADGNTIPLTTLHLPLGGHHLDGGAPLAWYDVDNEPVAMSVQHGVGQLVVVANDHVLDDGSLYRHENVNALVTLLGVASGSKVTIVQRDAERPSAAHELVEAGFGVAFAQLVLTWLLWGASQGRAFATRRPVTEAPPRDFVVHLRAVADFYRTSRASRVGLAAVAARALPRIRTAVGARDRGGDALADLVASRLGEDPYYVRNLIARAEAAAADPRGPPAPDEPWLTEALWTLTKRLAPSRR